jgi:hypothetical protein
LWQFLYITLKQIFKTKSSLCLEKYFRRCKASLVAGRWDSDMK